MSQHLEVETKFSVSETTEIPELTGIAGVAEVDRTETHHLVAVYFDTDDLRLTRAKITLRRRTGGHDAGWHIKFPDTFGRREVQAELDAPGADETTPPTALLGYVRAMLQGRQLTPVAEVANERHATYLKNDLGELIAEFCDDHVSTISYLPGGARKQWREWEFELAEGISTDDSGWELLTSAADVLTRAGAFVSDSPSKLVSALGESIRYAPVPPETAQLPEDDPAHAVLAAIEANACKIADYDPRVRADEWDSVHQMRVATRELRSHMQTFEGILGGEDYLQIEKELKLLASILGRARDAEVIEERLAALIDTEVGEVIDEDTRKDLLDDLRRDYLREHARVVATLDNERYARLLRSLEDLLVNPPLVTIPATPVEEPQGEEPQDGRGVAEDLVAQLDHSDEISDQISDQISDAVVDEPTELEEAAASEVEDAEGPDRVEGVEGTGEAPSEDSADPEPAAEEKVDAAQVLLEHLDKTHAKVVKLHKKAVKQWDDQDIPVLEREENFHNVRKAIKKLRYSAEAVGDATPVNTKKLYKACSGLQSVLGDFQDAVTSRDELLRRSRIAHRKGRDTFAYGVLYQHEKLQSRKYLEGYNDAYKSVADTYDKLEDASRKLAREAAKESAKKSHKKDKKNKKKK